MTRITITLNTEQLARVATACSFSAGKLEVEGPCMEAVELRELASFVQDVTNWDSVRA